MGNVSFLDAVMYVLKSFSKVPNVIMGGISNIAKSISNGIAVLGATGTHSDMTNSEEKLFSAYASNFYVGIVNAVISIILLILSAFIISGDLVSGGIATIITTIFGGIGLFAAAIWSLAIASVVVFFGKKYITSWNLILIKVLVVLNMLSCASSILSILITIGTSIFALFGDFVILTLIQNLVNIVFTLIGIVINTVIIDALSTGRVYSKDNSANMNNGYNQNMGYEQNNNFNQNNGYNPNIDLNKQDNQQNVQMYACPYCGKAIYQNQSPCPHCNNVVNW